MTPTPRSVKWSAYLCFAQAFIFLVSVFLLGPLIRAFFNSATQGPGRRSGMLTLFALAVSGIAYCILPLCILLFALLGIGLLRRWRWTRWGAIVVSGVNALLTFPLGSILGIAIIVLLLQSDAKQAFSRPPTTVPQPVVFPPPG
jgi:hypothetical protein